MAQLILTTVGTAVGGAIGGPLGAAIGGAIGSAIGAPIDQQIFGSTQKFNQEGPRLQATQVFVSSEGVSIVRGYGRFRTAGNLIWASRFREEVVTETTRSGGKGGSKPKTETTTTTYNYFANFAVGLCEGEIQGIGRVWADGKLINLSDFNHRIHRGTETQTPDSLITTKEGAGNVPAYRGLAYIVFEDFQINQFGNRLPQLNFEVIRPLSTSDNNTLVNGVTLLPGDNEFGYDDTVVERILISNRTDIDPLRGDRIFSRKIENNRVRSNTSDFQVAMDQLTETLPNLSMVNISVPWFVRDTRIAQTSLRPQVEIKNKRTDPTSWRVAGQARDSSVVLASTLFDGRPAFGGTPNDVSLYRAIRNLKNRGFNVMITPIIRVDTPPYADRKEIHSQTDGTAQVNTEINNFVGTAVASQFSGSGGTVNYSGANPWTYRRFVLHYAELCRQAGGVNYFCVGSGLTRLTQAQDQNGAYPFVQALRNLTFQVNQLLPLTQIGYAADWQEYGAHIDSSNNVKFPLDFLWTHPDIDFVGINHYAPLSDWRDGTGHLDYGSGNSTFGNPRAESIYDIDYLKGQIEGGEYYNYLYNTEADRLSQTRTAINDNIHGENWIFGAKRIREWWQSAHHPRTNGVRSSTPTAWVPQSKPIVFTEFGCSAIDRGTNQPDQFFDPKKTDDGIPHFSSASRDDEIQFQYLKAMIEYWSDAANNPISNVYLRSMIDTNRLMTWGYDVRPWPTFPIDGDTWPDQANWEKGPWISGRIDSIFLPDLLNKIAEDYDISATTDFTRAYGSCDGFVIEAKTSFRSSIEPLASLFLFSIIESGNVLKAVTEREVRSLKDLTLRDIADSQEEPIMLTRIQETEIPAGFSLRYSDTMGEYQISSVDQQREVIQSTGIPQIDAPIVIDTIRAQQIVDRLLYSAWAKRTTSEFGVLPEFLFLEPGDVVTIKDSGFDIALRLESVSDGTFRKITAKSFDLSIFEGGVGGSRSQGVLVDTASSPILFEIMDLPVLAVNDQAHQPYVIGFSDPWPLANVYKSITTSNFTLDTTLVKPTIMGETRSTLNAGQPDLWDNANTVDVEIFSGELSTLDDDSVLDGNNTIAIETGTASWEILQFVNAVLISPGTYRLSRLLRGQLGTEDNIKASLASGATVVLIDDRPQQLNIGLDDVRRSFNFRYGPANKDLGDATYRTISQASTGRGIRPFSPVHIKGTPSGGNMTISWIRRTRLGGDSWEYFQDVPLSEDFERYEIDISPVGSNTVVRTLIVTDTTEVVYTAAQRTSDNLTGDFDVVIYQISSLGGRGIPRRATIDG